MRREKIVHLRVIPRKLRGAVWEYSRIFRRNWDDHRLPPRDDNGCYLRPRDRTVARGPTIQRARGGFAAAVVNDQIVLGGGKIVNRDLRLERTVQNLYCRQRWLEFWPQFAFGS
jgi:hypothetical protein